MTQARVEIGDALKEDLARIEMELALTKVELQRVESLRAQSLVTLASAIGNASLSVKSLNGTLDSTFDIPTMETLASNLSSLPESTLNASDMRVRSARIDAVKAERIPDVKVELLYHRLEASRANTIDLGFSIPLPIFNRNQGKIREGRAELAAAEARSRQTQNELTARLRESYSQLTSALANCRTFKTEILVKADTVLKTAESRYEAGDISLIDLIPIRRDWASVQLTYLESLRDVMQAWAELQNYK